MGDERVECCGLCIGEDVGRGRGVGAGREGGEERAYGRDGRGAADHG